MSDKCVWVSVRVCVRTPSVCRCTHTGVCVLLDCMYTVSFIISHPPTPTPVLFCVLPGRLPPAPPLLCVCKAGAPWGVLRPLHPPLSGGVSLPAPQVQNFTRRLHPQLRLCPSRTRLRPICQAAFYSRHRLLTVATRERQHCF